MASVQQIIFKFYSFQAQTGITPIFSKAYTLVQIAPNCMKREFNGEIDLNVLLHCVNPLH